MCPNSNFQYKEPGDYCLSALFWRMKDQAHSLCKTALATDAVQITQTSPEEFYIYHPTDLTLTVQCPDSHEIFKHWRGSQLVRLKAGCRGFGEGYDVAAHPNFEISQVVTTSSISWTIRQLTMDLPRSAIDSYMPEIPKHKIMVEDLVSQMRLMESQRLIGNNYYPLSFASSATGSFLIFIFIGISCCCCCCFRNRLKSACFNLAGEAFRNPGNATAPTPDAPIIRQPGGYPVLPPNPRPGWRWSTANLNVESRPMIVPDRQNEYVMLHPVGHPVDAGVQVAH